MQVQLSSYIKHLNNFNVHHLIIECRLWHSCTILSWKITVRFSCANRFSRQTARLTALTGTLMKVLELRHIFLTLALASHRRSRKIDCFCASQWPILKQLIVVAIHTNPTFIVSPCCDATLVKNYPQERIFLTRPIGRWNLATTHRAKQGFLILLCFYRYPRLESFLSSEVRGIFITRSNNANINS